MTTTVFVESPAHTPTDRCYACGQPLGYWAVDKLTGLLDRWGWDEHAINIWKRVQQQRTWLALLIVDVDHFKGINDTIGHPAGDAVLKSVAQVLRDATRGSDIVGRYGGHGGDEFLILLPETHFGGAIAVARRIRAGIRATATVSELSIIRDLTVSIGIAAGRPGCDLEHLDELLLGADAALREAKNQGRDRICVGSHAGPAANPAEPVAREDLVSRHPGDPGLGWLL